MKTIYFFVLCIFHCFSSSGQTVSGMVKDTNNFMIRAASIVLKTTKDSTVVKTALTDTNGKYLFENVIEGTYFVHVSHTGYTTAGSDIFMIDSVSSLIRNFILTRTTATLKEVRVKYRKPMIEIKNDRMIFNVENSVTSASQNALELMRKTPGVVVDKDENLSLGGKSGVKVYIDGRVSPLTDKDLSFFLKSIASSQIEAIEIITNPSASYDASGNAGIINIRLRKNKNYGTNGSLTGSYSVAVFPKYNAGISFNRRKRSINFYGNFNYNRGLYSAYSNMYRILSDSIFDQHAEIRGLNTGYSGRAGADYTLNSRNSLGVQYTTQLFNNNMGTNSETKIIYAPLLNLDRVLSAKNSLINKRNVTAVNVNYRYADSSGHELILDADYGHYQISSNQEQPNIYYDPLANRVYSKEYKIISPSLLHIYSFKTDYGQGFKNGRLSFGAKTSYVSSNNDIAQFNVYPSIVQADSAYSNHFLYQENINALYISYSKTMKKVAVQVGLRAENTNVKGSSHGYKQDSTFDLHSTQLFPGIALNFNKNPQKLWTLNYSYRIDRPSYRDLNPFEFKLDDYSSKKGNTALTPQFTNSIGLTYLYRQSLISTLNYSSIRDVFTVLTDTINRSKIFLTKKNLATRNIASLNISYQKEYKWYGLFINANTYHSNYNADFGAGRTINLSAFSIDINLQQSFRFGKNWSGELTSFYNAPSILQRTYKSKGSGSVDVGIKKVLFKSQLIIAVAGGDLFYTLQNRLYSNFAGQKIWSTGGEESSQFRININYRFGNVKIKAVQQRKTGLEEENKRTNG